MSKLTDYGFVILNRFADHRPGAVVNARDLAEGTGLPLPTVSKVLKMLSRGNLVIAQRGVHGGYMLSRNPGEITAMEVIEALEGPVAITDCLSEESAGGCELETSCRLKGHWQVITEVVRRALSEVSLAQLASPASAKVAGGEGRNSGNCATDSCTGAGDACGCSGHDRFRDNGVTK